MKIWANAINHDAIYDRQDEIMDFINSHSFADGMKEMDLFGLLLWLHSFDSGNCINGMDDTTHFVTFYEKENDEYQAICVYYVDEKYAMHYIDVVAEREERRKLLIAEKVWRLTNDILHDGKSKDTVESTQLKIDNDPYEVIEELLEVIGYMDDKVTDLLDAERETYLTYSVLKDQIKGGK